MAIDTHQHFWQYDPIEYDWIDESMKRIRRDFLPADLRTELPAARVAGAISVQARQTIAETDWLLSLAANNDFLLGVIGWLPLAAENVSELLDNYAAQPKFKGLRHVVQGEPDGFLDQPDFNRGIRALTTRNLLYEILVLERQLPEAIRFVDRHPEQTFVLDHVAKPRIAQNLLEPWRTNLRHLAERENVCCKLSGMVTEADYHGWTPEQLRPYLDAALEAFGPQRLMFGSDWPVCLVATRYADWADLIRDFIAPLSLSEQASILEGNARQTYRLD